MAKLSRRDFLRWMLASGIMPLLPVSAEQNTDTPPIIVDAHLDLGYNISNFGRDYRRSALAIRAEEAGSVQQAIAGQATIGLPELLAARVALIFGVIFVLPAHQARSALQVAHYNTPEEARGWGVSQLHGIQALADQSESIEIVKSSADLTRILQSWENGNTGQVGIVLAMEGADPIASPDDLHWWYEQGLRSVGLSWGRTRYAGSNSETSRLSSEGFDLLREMRTLNMMLDTAHLSEAAFWDALNVWDGVTAYTHGTLRPYLPTQRALSNEQIQALVAHDGVIGIGVYNGFFAQNYDSPRGPTIDDVVNAIDTICQLAGNCNHVAIGSDLDGGFGAELTPQGINTIADLQQIVTRLSERGFSAADINRITHENWLRLLRQVL